MPAVAMFYHLKSAGLDDTVTMILNRAIGQGWNHLDAKLWLGTEDSFLPHGLQGGPQDADQPVLLGSGTIDNGAKGLFLLAGADVEPAELTGLERVWVLFDGHDMAAVQVARAQWTRLTGWGLAAQYWSDETGSWVKKVEKAAVQSG